MMTRGRFVALFAVAFFAAGVVIGLAPVNHMLARYIPDRVGAIWSLSLLSLIGRTAAAAIAASLALELTLRARRFATTGYVRVGIAIFGALAGALDVIVHRALISQLIEVHSRTHGLAVVLDVAISAVVAFVVALLISYRITARSSPMVAEA